MSSQQKTHVLLVTLPFQGHMNPMLRLAKRLVSKGHDVTIATTDTARHVMPAAGPIWFEFFSDGLDPGFDRNGRTDVFFEYLDTHGSESFSGLVAHLGSNGRKFGCLVTSPFLPWAVDVARAHGVPCAVLWIQSCAVYDIYYHFVRSPGGFGSLEDPNGAVSVPGLPVMAARDMPSLIRPPIPAHIRKLVAQFVQVFTKVKWVLGSSFHELEEGVVEAMAATCPILPIGPLVSPELFGKEETVAGNANIWIAEDSCIEWLHTQPPSSVIYLAFGSITVLSQLNMDNISNALKNCGKPFLWVVKPAEKGFEKKSGELSSEFLEETKGRGLVVKWAPQEKVLMHESVGCFVTHCGWNSCIEAVVAGVPVITFPDWTDQPANAKLLVDLFKTGVSMPVGDDGVVASQEAERCFRELTEGPKSTELKMKAMEWKEAARRAVEDGGSSDRNLDQFISETTG